MVKYKDDARHIHRLPPCSVYEAERFQSWLEDMAQQGFLLDRDGFFMGFASFELSRPCRLSYRLQPAEKEKPAFDEGEPDTEQAELSSAMGWDYVARFKDFHIYRSGDPQAPELNTDPAVQAMALKKVSRRIWGYVFNWLFWVILYPLLILRGKLLLTAVVLGDWFVIFYLVFFLWVLLHSIIKIRSLHRLRQRLKLGEALNGPADWRRGSLRHRAGRILEFLMWLGWTASIILALFSGLDDSRSISLEDYGEPPFATLRDFYPEAECSHGFSMSGLGLNSVEEYSSLSVPLSCHWREHAELEQDGAEFSAGYYIYYHETASPRLALLLAHEHQLEDRLRGNFQELELDVEGVDYSAAWQDETHFPKLILQKGSRVVMATLLQYGGEPLSLEQWAAILAESLE